MSQESDKSLELFVLERIKLCDSCEHYKAYFCTKCGCFMPVKIRLKSAMCPIYKWMPL